MGVAPIEARARNGKWYTYDFHTNGFYEVTKTTDPDTGKELTEGHSVTEADLPVDVAMTLTKLMAQKFRTEDDL